MKKYTCTLVSVLLLTCCAHFLSATEAVVGGLILEDISLNVPDDFETVQDALSWLDTKQISREATVTIQMADGTYTDYETITFDHSNGDRIQLVGNTSNPGNVTIHFATGQNGIDVTKSGIRIDGMTLVGNYPNDSATGVRVMGSSVASVRSGVSISGFYHGIQVAHSSSCLAYGVTLTGNNNGAFVTRCSYLDLKDATVSGNTSYAIVCKANSAVHIGGATISGSTLTESGGVITSSI